MGWDMFDGDAREQSRVATNIYLFVTRRRMDVLQYYES